MENESILFAALTLAPIQSDASETTAFLVPLTVFRNDSFFNHHRPGYGAWR